MPMTYSVETFPPKDELGEARLWEAMDALRVMNLDFISVTYGAGGSTRDRTVRITKEIKERTGTKAVAHLTCVGSTKSELIEILNQYKSAGIRSVLALRGDPTGGPKADWIPTPGGFTHADELVELITTFGGFDIGVAAFPDGHPASHGNFEEDIETLLRKERLGATFAITQFFFEAANYFRLIEALEKNGSNLKIIPGVLPVTNVKQLERMAELGGTPIPTKISKIFESATDAEDVKKIGIELATNLCSELIENEVPGIHFYPMNNASSTLAIGRNLGIIRG
jgi:methylenetetrahydrofolate reductase (NADPH)